MEVSPQMERRNLGKIGPKVSLLGTSCRGSKELHEFELELKQAIDYGVNFFDTADIYDDGQAEEMLRLSLKGVPRDSYLLSTKGGIQKFRPGVAIQNSDPKCLRRSLEESLKRLGTDYIDLYQLHSPDPEVPLIFVAETFARFIEEGKVRYVGVCNMTSDDLYEWLKFLPETVSIQLPYSVLCKERADSVLGNPRLKDLLDRGISVSLIPYDPLFYGFIPKPPSSILSERQDFWAKFDDEFVQSGLRMIQVLDEISAKKGVSRSAVALMFAMERHDVATVPVKPAELCEGLKALELTLTLEEQAAILECGADIPYPDIPWTTRVYKTLLEGKVAVLSNGLKVRVPQPLSTGDEITVNIWDGSVKWEE
jgi:aryl-alcohol dehydrogenase-like predicted oxidoreductase